MAFDWIGNRLKHFLATSRDGLVCSIRAGIDRDDSSNLYKDIEVELDTTDKTISISELFTPENRSTLVLAREDYDNDDSWINDACNKLTNKAFT